MGKRMGVRDTILVLVETSHQSPSFMDTNLLGEVLTRQDGGPVVLMKRRRCHAVARGGVAAVGIVQGLARWSVLS